MRGHGAVLAGFGLALGLAACGHETSPAGPGSNRAPEIRNVSVSPSSVGLGGSADVRVEALDPDGDALFYRYEADVGRIVADPATPSRAVFTNTDPAGRTTARLTIHVVDARNAASTFSASVGLQGNQAPRVRVSVGRASCHPDCTVSVTAVAEDAEGDLLSFAWSGCASGVARAAECRVRNVGPATAIVTASDPRGGVGVASATVSGTNAVPVVAREGGEQRPSPSRLIINPTDADAGDDPRCAWRGDCTCTGDFQSWNVNCEVAAGGTSCTMTAYCWDGWGGVGEARFRLLR